MTKRVRLHRRHKPSAGFALIAVLWTLALLLILATTAIAITRNSAQLAKGAFDASQAKLLADSAIRLAVFHIISNSRGPDSWYAGDRRTLDLWGQKVVVTAENEAGRIDLNYADTMLLADYFFAAGISATEAGDLATRIADRRSTQSERFPRGRRFASVEELFIIPGAEKLSPQIKAGLTVYTRAAAPRIDVSNELVRSVAISHGDRIDIPTPAGDPRRKEATRLGKADILRITACVTRTARCRLAVLRISGNRAVPIAAMAWNTSEN